ncbi:MAG TPA: glycosyltransferase [Trueperaceae bacterium]
MTLFLVLLYALVLPYVALMLIVCLGMFLSRKRPRSMATPSVSVIIPAHNEEDKLAATLESLSRQQYGGPLEFVIVNDRSTDATRDIIRSFVDKDARFRLVDVSAPSRRLAPKVNAVNIGIQNSSGEIILTSDADCQYPAAWVGGMVSYFAPDVAMVVGYVETTQPGVPARLLHRFESTDWLSLMLVSRSLTHFGWSFASSANNQGYRRSAFEDIGGFGASGRAPSGDEDLLTQRMGRLQQGRVVFATAPETRVLTRPMPTLHALLNQRRRWVSRYHHMLHYHPLFWLSVAVLGAQSVLLSLAIVLSFVFPALAPFVLGLWVVKLAVEYGGMYVGTELMGRRDLWGVPVLIWAPLHPFFIATVVLWSLARPGEWRAGAMSYRRRFFKRQWREWRRKLRGALLG